MRPVIFEGEAFKQFVEWSNTDRKIFKKINDLITDIDRNPFKGIGKPEPLKHQYQGYWSRRINEEHRIVYKISEDKLVIAACFGHYDD